jgi:hypothetical protein
MPTAPDDYATGGSLQLFPHPATAQTIIATGILRQILLVVVRPMPGSPLKTTRLLPSPVSTGRLSVDRKIDRSIDLRGQKDTFVATELPKNICVCRCSVAFERLIQIFAPRSEVDQ